MMHFKVMVLENMCRIRLVQDRVYWQTRVVNLWVL